MTRQKQPPGNKSPEAIALREAASRWGENPPVIDYDDSLGVKANRDLLAAAVAYAAVAERETRLQERADRCRRIKLTKAELLTLAMFPADGGIPFSELSSTYHRDVSRLLEVYLLTHYGRRNVGLSITTDGMVKLAISRGLVTESVVVDGQKVRIL